LRGFGFEFSWIKRVSERLVELILTRVLYFRLRHSVEQSVSSEPRIHISRVKISFVNWRLFLNYTSLVFPEYRLLRPWFLLDCQIPIQMTMIRII